MPDLYSPHYIDLTNTVYLCESDGTILSIDMQTQRRLRFGAAWLYVKIMRRYKHPWLEIEVKHYIFITVLLKHTLSCSCI